MTIFNLVGWVQDGFYISKARAALNQTRWITLQKNINDRGNNVLNIPTTGFTQKNSSWFLVPKIVHLNEEKIAEQNQFK